MDRSVLRLGAVAAIVGAIVGMVGNVLHPRGPDYSIPAELRFISQNDIWLFAHFLISLAIAITFIGLVVIARSFEGEPAASWARLALSSAILGSTLGMVLLLIDGFGTAEAARAWAATPTPVTEGTASALITINYSLFTGLMLTLFGITPLLYGAAVLTSGRYPKWLGYLALAAGAICLTAGIIQYLTGIGPLTANVLFPIGSLAFSLWTLVMGWQLWKRSLREVDSAPESATA